ncbi:MFS transporter [Pseudarthrobacter sp. J1738]|uniref:MFS transporter n=1 Tax=Pseudarthrobacter sp. J1738 TaxID=3420446 RepID=UPI003D28ED65
MSQASSTPPRSASKPRLVLGREIRVLVAAAFFIALGYGLVAPVLPQFARSFNVDVGAAAAVISVFALARLIFAPSAGSLVERFGERGVYITGILVVAASSVACAFAAEYWQLLLFRGLGGLGSTMFTVSAMSLLVRLAPDGGRGRVTSAYSGAFLLGNITGPVFGGILGQFGLHLAFLVYAGTLVIAAGLVAYFLRPSALAPVLVPVDDAGTTVPGPAEEPLGAAAPLAAGPAAPAAGTPATSAAPDAPAMTLREALGLRTYRAALASGFSTGWSSFGVRMALVPLFAVVVLDAGPQTAGASLAVFAIGTGLALFFAGKLADSWGRRPMMILGLTVNGLAMAGLGFSTSVPVFVILSAVAGFGSGLFSPAQQASVADIIGSRRSGGKVLATFQMVQDLGTIIGPIAAGVMVDLWSYGPAFALAAATSLLAAAYWLRAPETLETATRPAILRRKPAGN